MSEVGAPAVSPNTANDANVAANMPPVPKDAPRMRPSDFMKQRRNGELPGRTNAPAPAQQPQQPPPQQQTRNEHMGELARQLENKLSEPKEPANLALREETGLAQPDGELPQLGDERPTSEENQQAAGNVLSDAEALAKFRDWEASDLAPEEVFADKLHAVKVRGQERYVDYAELRQGYMRHGDYTARGNELKQREQQIEQQAGFYKQHFEQIRDPENFLEIYERNGYGDVLERVAERIADRRVEHRNLVRAAGRAAAEARGYTAEQINAGMADNDRYVADAMTRADARLKDARKLEIENRKLAAERERFEAQRQQSVHAQEVAKHKSTYDNQLNQLRPLSFRAHGIQDTPQNRTAFVNRLQEVVQLQGLPDEGFTRDMVMSAARAVAEDIADRKQAEGRPYMSDAEQRAAAQAQARSKALGATRVGTGAGKPLGNPQAQRMRPSDFAKARRDGTLGR